MADYNCSLAEILIIYDDEWVRIFRKYRYKNKKNTTMRKMFDREL